ncbi:MAG TPA: hypothetical protein VJ728_05510, partial [Candidatus Binataceae bacterium]|nr:hypothetical protein [Candidatus Binataceae bacterium]
FVYTHERASPARNTNAVRCLFAYHLRGRSRREASRKSRFLARQTRAGMTDRIQLSWANYN